MLAVKQYHDMLLITDLVPYSIVTDPDTVLIFISFQFDAPTRTWMLFQHHNPLDDLVTNIVWQIIQLLLYWLWDHDSVAHQSFLRRRAMYSSIVT